MKTVLLAAALALSAVLAGCSGWPIGGQAASAPAAAVPQVAADQGKFLAAQGQAGPAPAQKALNQADEAARNRLAAAISDYTRTTARAFLASDGADASPLARPFTDTLAAQVSTDILRSAGSRETWVGTDGVTHVLYRVPVALVDDKIVEGARQCVTTSNPFGKDAGQVAAGMEEFLQGRLRERLKVAARTAPHVASRAPQELTPAWLEAGRHTAYPTDKFISAIGLGADRLAADESARDELAAVVNGRLQGQLRALPAAPDGSPIEQDVEHLSPASLRFSAKDLAATRIAEHWHDAVTGTYYALGVLDRASAPLLYRDRLGEAQSKARSLTEQASNDATARKYAAALVDYMDALSAATQALRLQLAALAVAPKAQTADLRALTAEPLVAPAKAGLNTLLGQIALTPVSGDDQWVAPGEAPRAPLVVQTAAGPDKVPLPDVPLRFSVLAARQPILARTDEAGTARCTLAGPLPGSPHRGTVTASLDLAQLAAGADISGLTAPSVAFHYALRSRENTVLAVYFYDAGSGGGAAPVTALLKAAFTTAGWRLLDDASVLGYVRAGKPAPDASPADAIDAAGMRRGLAPEQSLLVIVGCLHTHLTGSVHVSEGDLKIVNCDYSLVMLDSESGQPPRTLMTADGTGRGAYTDDEVEASTRAIQDAAHAIDKKIEGVLAAKFGPSKG